MTSPSEPASVSERTATALAPVLGRRSRSTGLRQLSGGASRETWSFTANGEALILRRDPPGRPGHARLDAARGRRDARVQRAPASRAPEVLLDDDGTLLGTAGLVMAHVAGRDASRGASSATTSTPRARAHARRRPRPSSSPGCTRSIPPRCRARSTPTRSRSRGPRTSNSTTQPDVREDATSGCVANRPAAHRDDDRARRPAARAT